MGYLDWRRNRVFCKCDVLEHDWMEFRLLELQSATRYDAHLHDRNDFLSGLIGHIDLIIPKSAI
jgi:hypothetical protein